MPVNFLSEAERLRFNSFPADLSAEEGFKRKGLRELRKPEKDLWRKLLKTSLKLTSLEISPLLSLPQTVSTHPLMQVL